MNIQSISFFVGENTAVTEKMNNARRGFGETDGRKYYVLTGSKGGYIYKDATYVSEPMKKYLAYSYKLGFGQARALVVLMGIHGAAAGKKIFDKWFREMGERMEREEDRAERRDAAKELDATNVVKARLAREAVEKKNAQRVADAKAEQDALKAKVEQMRKAIQDAKDEAERKRKAEAERIAAEKEAAERKKLEEAVKAEQDAADKNTKEADDTIVAIGVENAAIKDELAKLQAELDAIK